MVTWGATSTTSINNGSQDAYITAQATRLKNLGAPVILRYFHKPEGAYRSTIVGSPTAYINAWKHARSLFTAAGATNVVWMFTTTAYSFRVVSTPSPQAFYPGHDQVDWIAADGYNFAPGKPGAKLNSFQTIFAKWYAWAATWQTADGGRVRRDGRRGGAQSQGDLVRRDARHTVRTGMPSSPASRPLASAPRRPPRPSRCTRVSPGRRSPWSPPASWPA